MKYPKRLTTIIVLFFALLLFLPFLGNIYLSIAPSTTQKAIDSKLSKESTHKENLSFNLLDPEQAPEGIHDTVMYGFHIMTNTPKYAEKYVGNELSCTNCHFSAGNTTGGKNGSISLAGIAAVYPDYNSRAKEVVTLAERVNSCFERSMNGKALPLNSPEMDAIMTYLHWISKGFSIYSTVPWRGLEMIKENNTPDKTKGAKIYEEKCAICHGNNGEGGIRIPPLWGPGAFNDGAGMNKIKILSAFIYANMPYEDPGLSEDQAYDVASFIIEQERPHYTP